MRYGKGFALVGVLVLAGGLTLRADVWDAGTTDDVPTQARNHLIHGSEQVHDLAAKAGVADNDWYFLFSREYSSFELIVDGLTFDSALSDTGVTRRLAATPGTIVQQAINLDGGYSKGMTWLNTTNTKVAGYVLVDGAQATCTTTCTANAQYRVRLLDTTFAIPRFNNNNGQVTVLLVQNSTGNGVQWAANYWTAAGALITQVPGTLAPWQTAVVNLSTISALQNQTGAITVMHEAGYGGLAVKSVALEPATGFSFDTLGTYRSR